MRVIRRIYNWFLHLLAQFLPGAESIRPFLHRLRGVKIHGRVHIGDQSYLENDFPELIEMHEGAGLAIKCTLLCHAHQRKARIILEKDAIVFTGAYILAAEKDIIIGTGSVVGANSVVLQSVPPYTFVAGNPAKPIAKCGLPMKLETPLTDWKENLTFLKEK